nr:immunoglobulin heavy chain [Hydrolagus colliei]
MSSLIPLSLLLALFSCVQGAVVLTQPATLTGKPGTAVRLTCRTSGFNLGSYRMHWVRQVPGKGLEWLLHYYTSSSNGYAPGIESRVTVIKEDSNNIFDLIIKSPTVHDTAIYYCAREILTTGWDLDYWGQGTMLTVTDATPTAPSLYALLPTCGSPPLEGQLTFGCLAADFSPEPATFSWTSKGHPIANKGQVKSYPPVLSKAGFYTASSQLTIEASQVDIFNLCCQVKSSIWLDGDICFPVVQPSPPVVLLTQTSPEDIALINQATLLCSVSGFRPDKLIVDWLKDGKAVTSGIETSPSLKDNGNFSTDSRLTIPAKDWRWDVVYSCRVTHDPSQTLIIKNITNWNPECLGEVKVSFLPPSPKQVLLGDTVTLTCVVTEAPSGVNVTWTQGHMARQSARESRSAQRVTSELNVSTREWNGGKEFECVANHVDMLTPKRGTISKKPDQDTNRPSVYLLLPSPEELSAHQWVTLTCLVKEFAPKEIFVEWAVNDQAIDASQYTNTEAMAANTSHNYSMYSMLSVSAGDWDKGNTYSCVVGHRSFNSSKTLTRYVNKTSGKPTFVNVSLVLVDTVKTCQ